MHSVHISHRHAVPKDSCSGSNRSSQALPSSVIFKHCLQYQQHSPNSATDRPVKRGTGHIPASHSQVEAQQAARLAVFVSGGGSNLKAIHKRIIQVQLVVSDKPGCGGWQYAEQQGIATLHYNPKDKTCPPASQVVEQLQAAGIDYVALAGYLKLVPAPLVAAYHRRMVNIHPGLLPEFGGPSMYGTRVHAATLESGAKESGATVHFVDEVYDQGPILQKATVPVLPDDTPASLAARVLEQEHVLYSTALSHLVDGRVQWDESSQLPIVIA